MRTKAKDFDGNLPLKHDFDIDSYSQNIDEFIKFKLKQEFGLVPDPSEFELKQIIKRKPKKVKGKIVLFRDFIKRNSIPPGSADLLDSDIIDTSAEVIKESIKIKNSN